MVWNIIADAWVTRCDKTVPRAVSAPVLLIHSKRDTVSAPNASVEAFKKIVVKNKRAVWLKISNHIVFRDFERVLAAREVPAFLQFVAHNRD